MTTGTRTPRVAVLLPVYNGEKYLVEAVHSVLTQTFSDFELIVIDDGSTDRGMEMLEDIADARLRVIRFTENRGLVAALNHGIRESRSELIARMDHDDICMPRRLERQVSFLDSHPRIQLCGSWTKTFGDRTELWRTPVDPKQIHARLFFSHAIDHPSIMLRRDFFERCGLAYDAAFKHVEDVDLFQRAASRGDLANLPEVLLRTRAHSEETSVIHAIEQLQTMTRLLVRQLRTLLPDATADEERFHIRILDCEIDPLSLPRAEQWLLRLDQANRERTLYDLRAFRRELRLQSNRLYNFTSGDSFIAILKSYRDLPRTELHEIRVRGYMRLIFRLAFFRLLRAARAFKRYLRGRGAASTAFAGDIR